MKIHKVTNQTTTVTLSLQDRLICLSNTEIISVIEGFSLSILFRLFWSDWETDGIHSVDKETGQDVETVAQGLDRPTQFALFQATPPGL